MTRFELASCYTTNNSFNQLSYKPKRGPGYGPKGKEMKGIYYIGLIIITMGIIGYISNRDRSMIMMLISMEMILFGISYLIILNTVELDDLTGINIAIYLLAIAGAESATGLGILVVYYKVRGSSEVLLRSIRGEGIGKKEI